MLPFTAPQLTTTSRLGWLMIMRRRRDRAIVRLVRAPKLNEAQPSNNSELEQSIASESDESDLIRFLTNKIRQIGL